MSLPIADEQIPTGEDELIKNLAALQVRIMMGKKPPFHRGQHGKHHGCADAELVVHGDVPEALRVGLFKEPGTYKVKVRWSNGAADDDRAADVHGMAVKVLGVKGTPALEGSEREEQDFILIDNETFFVPDVQMMLGLMTARVTSEVTKDPKVMAEFAGKHPDVVRALTAAKKQIASPLTTQYWSTVPYKLGDGAVKYTAVPAGDNESGDVPATSNDYLRAAMASQLGTGGKGARFALCVIPQAAGDQVEDPTLPWQSQRVRVATITVQPQEFDTPERMKEAEELSFDPWHALAEHRPLGGINRARRAVYAASVNLRQSAAAV